MRKSLAATMLTIAALLVTSLMGCGFLSDSFNPESSLPIDVLKYGCLEAGEVVVVKNDGTEEFFKNKYKNGTFVNDGISLCNMALCKPLLNDESMRKEYEDAIVVCKGYICYTLASNSYTKYSSIDLEKDADEYSPLGADITFEFPSEEIERRQLTVGKEVLCAGYLDFNHLELNDINLWVNHPVDVRQ